MDKATNALDIKTENKILHAIKENFPDLTVIISHRPETLTTCDTIFHLDEKNIKKIKLKNLLIKIWSKMWII